MTQYEIISIVISGLSLAVAAGGVVYAGIQLKCARKALELSLKVHSADHDWNRRMAAQDTLKEYNQSTITSLLQKNFDYLNRKEAIPLTEVEAKMSSNPELQNELHQLLNFYEGLARGVFQQIYDEDVIKSGRRGAMIKALRAFGSYIEDRRVKFSPKAWCELESLVAKWVLEEKGRMPRESTTVRS